jgi:hypothetical protein
VRCRSAAHVRSLPAPALRTGAGDRHPLQWIGENVRLRVRDPREGGRPAIVEATSIQVCYDYAAKRSMPMPYDLRRKVEAFEGRPLTRGANAGPPAR